MWMLGKVLVYMLSAIGLITLSIPRGAWSLVAVGRLNYCKQGS